MKKVRCRAFRASERLRPRLPQACQPLVPWLVPRAATRTTDALSHVPDSVLRVKVHGLGDSVMVRSLIEELQRRQPWVRMRLMVGSANCEVMTLGTESEVYVYDQANLSLAAIVRQLNALRQGRYEAMLNFEQDSLAGTAFLRAPGIPVSGAAKTWESRGSGNMAATGLTKLVCT